MRAALFFILFSLIILLVVDEKTPTHNYSILGQNVYGDGIVWAKFPIVISYGKDVPDDFKILFEKEVNDLNSILN